MGWNISFSKFKNIKKHYEEVGLKKNFQIIDTDDQLKLIKNICEIEKIDTKEVSAKYYLNSIDSFKNKGIILMN